MTDILFVASLCFLLAGIYGWVNERIFWKQARTTVGIADAPRNTYKFHTAWSFLVQPQYGEDIKICATSLQRLQKRIRKGDLVKVAWRKRKRFGKEGYQLRIVDRKYVKTAKTYTYLAGISISVICATMATIAIV